MTENMLAVKKKYSKMFSVGFEPVLSAANSKHATEMRRISKRLNEQCMTFKLNKTLSQTK